MKGGTVRITAGEGSSDQLNDGGDGGDMILTAGEAKGSDSNDNGGRISLTAGAANYGYGGSLDISSGKRLCTFGRHSSAYGRFWAEY